VADRLPVKIDVQALHRRCVTGVRVWAEYEAEGKNVDRAVLEDVATRYVGRAVSAASDPIPFSPFLSFCGQCMIRPFSPYNRFLPVQC